MVRVIRLSIIFSILLISITLISCNSATTQSNTTLNGIGSSNGVDSNYTLITLPPPGNTAESYYNDLLTNLTTKQSNLAIDRILISTQNPVINPELFAIESTVVTSGLAVQFIAKLAQSNSGIQIYAYPNVEGDSQWESWIPPSSTPEPASCNAINPDSNDTEHNDVLKSICWVSLVNNIIAKDSIKSAVSGVAYDGQEFILGDSDESRSWVHTQAINDGLLLGWISGGLKSSVDLNLVELYNIEVYNKIPQKTDEIEPQSIISPYFSENYLTKVCSGGYCTLSGIFPGTQYATNESNSPSIGAVGANIYQCAISNGNSELESNSCDATYTNTTAIDLTANPATQMLQSWIYIYNSAQPILGTIDNFEAGSSIVYLFSTEYIGPIKSYYGSNLQCSEESNNCSCMASLYDPKASCGDGNNFGTWGNNLSDFKSFTTQFLNYQVGNTSCPAPGGCAVGIYTYDFIPQKWFNN